MLKILLLVAVLASALLLSPSVSAQLEPITPQDNKAKQTVIEALSKAVENHYSQIGMLNISRVNDTGNVQVVINSSAPTTTPPPVVTPPPPTCQTGYHLENGVCVKDPTAPVTTYSNIIFTADVDDSSAGKAVYAAIKAKNPTFVFVLGDLGYDSSLSWFKSTYGTLKSKQLDPTGKLRCLAGNHESANEDGSSSIESETKAFCGTAWRQTIGNTAVFGFNSNGNLDLTGPQYIGITKSLTNTTYMKNIKNVILASHKPCETNPNSHHPVESKVKGFCDAVKSKVPSTATMYMVAAGHNHVLAQKADGKAFISGAGGRSHYDCGTDSSWNYCNNTTYGYLNLKIDRTTGAITSHFYNSAGSQIH